MYYLLRSLRFGGSGKAYIYLGNSLYVDEFLNLYIDIPGGSVDRYSDGRIYSIGSTKFDYFSDGRIYSIGEKKFDYYSDGRIYSIGGTRY